MCWSLAIAFSKVGGLEGLQAVVPNKQLGLGEALTIIVGTFISGGTQATNWSRFANSGRTAALGTLAAFSLANGFVVFGGAFCSLAYGNEDMVQVMAQQGLMFWGLVLLFLNMWSTQDNTIYAFSVAGAHAFRSNKRTAFVLGGATIALALALGGIYESKQFINFLILLGTFIPPIGGVIVADYWLYRRGHFPSLEERQPAFNWVGVIAYVVASAIAYFSPGIKPINGIIAAIILYFVLSKVIPQPSQSRATNS
jgi:cytosine permease